MPGPPRQPRYPLEPLAALCRQLYQPNYDRRRSQVGRRSDCGIVVAVTGRNAGTVCVWAREGISETSADRVAVQLGYHPLNIWPDWGSRTPVASDNPRGMTP